MPLSRRTHTQSFGGFAVFTQLVWEIAAGERAWFNDLFLRSVSTLYFLKIRFKKKKKKIRIQLIF